MQPLLDKIKYKLQGVRLTADLRHTKTLCMFIGYPRSGHSVIGAMLDAHPHAVISHELDIIEKLKTGFSMKQIAAMIIENAAMFAQNGRKWSNYDYTIPDQWQGNYQQIKVIGDKKGGRTARHFHENPALSNLLAQRSPWPVKMIHVTRNPFDNIITRAYGGNETQGTITPERIHQEMDRHFQQAGAILQLKHKNMFAILDIRHEDLISSPETTLQAICAFLDLEASADYLKDCASLVFKKPHKTRQRYPLSEELIQTINQKMAPYPFFTGYTYND